MFHKNAVIYVMDYGYGRCIHGHHPRRVGSIGLFLNLSKSRFVYGIYRDQGMYSFELIRM